MSSLPKINKKDFVPWKFIKKQNEFGDEFWNFHDALDQEIYENDIVAGISVKKNLPKDTEVHKSNYCP